MLAQLIFGRLTLLLSDVLPYFYGNDYNCCVLTVL